MDDESHSQPNDEETRERENQKAKQFEELNIILVKPHLDELSMARVFGRRGKRRSAHGYFMVVRTRFNLLQG